MKIINFTIDFVQSTKRFDGPLLSTVIFVCFCLLPHVMIHQAAKDMFIMNLLEEMFVMTKV